MHVEKASELKDRGLYVIAQSIDAAEGCSVVNAEMPQIALLRSAIFNRVERSQEAASALLGLVLCYIAPIDPRWRNFKAVQAKKSGEVVTIEIRDSLWVSDLRSRSWVPHSDEDEDKTIVSADPLSLLPLLDPKWLDGNDAGIELLSECFGFDALDVRLLGLAPDEEERQELRNGLARLVLSHSLIFG